MRDRRRRAALLVLALLAAAAPACGRGGEPAPAPLLVAEFTGPDLDPAVWGTCHWWADPGRGCTIASNDELEWYRPEQVRPGGGVLRLVAERRDTAGDRGRRYPYASGMVSTGPPFASRRPRFAFRYGRAEMRARVPRGDGLWPAFWLLPASRESRPEIDVMEVLGHDPDTLRMHLHVRGADGARGSRGHDVRTEDLSRDFHVYAIDWRPGVLRWLLDGREVWRVEGAAVPDEPMYLVANLAVGGWAGAPARDAAPAELVIDHIRVTG